MPTSNQINANDIQPNQMLSESNMRAVSNNEHTIGQSAQQQQQQQQQYISQGGQPLVPVSYQYVVPEQWPYPQYYQQQQPQPQAQMCQVQEPFQSNSSDSNGSNPSSTSVAISSAVSTAALSNGPGPAMGSNSNNSNSNSSSNVPYYYYYPQMQATQSMAYSYPQAYYYYPANSDGTTNPSGIASSVTNIQNQNSDLEKNYSTFELQQQQQQQQQLQAQAYPSQAPIISNVSSKSNKSGPPSETSTGSISPSSNRTSRNSNGAASLTQQLPMPNYPKPSTYQFPGFHKTSSISNPHLSVPPRPSTTPTQVPVITQKDPVNYNHPQMGLLPQQQQVSPLYDGNSMTPPVKATADQETYLTANRQGKCDQQYDPMTKAMNSFQTTTIRHPMPVIAAASATSGGSNSGAANIIRPRVTTTMWEDEKTLCYQVEANGISVVRRADNDMINGTKLLNVTKMTRGRRDGILKAEKIRHVVKIGSMHLKGVWIPFERALAIAQREKIADYLYPLFIKDIQSVLKQNNLSNDSTSSSSSTAGLKSISPRTYYQPIDNYQNANAPTSASAAQLAYSSMNLNSKNVHNNPISAVTTIGAGQRPLSQYPIPNMNQADVFTMANAQNISTTMPMKQQDSRIVSPLSYPRNTIISPVSRLGNTSGASRVFTLSPHTTSTNQASEANVGSLHTGITLPRVGSESASRSEGSEEADGNDKATDNENTKELRSSQLPISALTSTYTGTRTTSTSEDIAHSNEPTEAEPSKEPASFKSQVGNPEGVFKKVTTTNDIKKQE